MKIDKIDKISALKVLVIAALALGLAIDAGAYEMKSNNDNRVRVDVQPVQLTPGQPMKFEVRMNTHSADLGQDMAAVSTLKDNNGREYKATAWQGSPPGGHHRKGVLEFPNLTDNTESITLVIRDIDNVPERIFNWGIAK
ncbi:MAG: hypothetical protein JSW26_08855 [Desulfobacterales bacterium]|nr:MAG: hypothetical protein JSW26_08855 [Desulfobacterales bacterium]